MYGPDNCFLCFFCNECSEFSDIFDMEHFKKVLADDVRIVSSLPSTHIMTRPVEEKRTPLHVSPSWIRSRYLKRVRITSCFEPILLLLFSFVFQLILIN